jgi:hypothetical protein
MLCRICQNNEAPQAAHGFDLCNECAVTYGVMPMPEPRRPARPCNRCNGARFIRVIPRELFSTRGGTEVEHHAAPMTLTIVSEVRDSFWSSKKKVPEQLDPHKGRGLLEAYVCRGCGFIEWYCVDPDSIPVGPEFMAQEIDYGAAPYR